MIYFTTLISTLLLSHIARATPACGDVASPKDTYDLYDNEQQFSVAFQSESAVFDPSYENNPGGNTASLACGSRLTKYPKYSDIPGFPLVGGAMNAKPNTDGCGSCWLIINRIRKK